MTYVIGWLTQTGICITGDMAITKFGSDNEKKSYPFSSLAEPHYYDQEKSSEESLSKVISLSDYCLLGYAGAVDIALDIANQLELRLFQRRPSSMQDFTDDLYRSIFDCLSADKRADIQLVLAIYIKDEPYLLSYNYDGKCIITQHASMVQIGSMSSDPDISKVTWGILSFLYEIIYQKRVI